MHATGPGCRGSIGIIRSSKHDNEKIKQANKKITTKTVTTPKHLHTLTMVQSVRPCLMHMGSFFLLFIIILIALVVYTFFFFFLQVLKAFLL